jgi:hypothetical protein
MFYDLFSMKMSSGYPRYAEAGTVRWRQKSPATMSAIADAVRWAEEIMKAIDERWPAGRGSSLLFACRRHGCGLRFPKEFLGGFIP